MDGLKKHELIVKTDVCEFSLYLWAKAILIYNGQSLPVNIVVKHPSGAKELTIN